MEELDAVWPNDPEPEPVDAVDSCARGLELLYAEEDAKLTPDAVPLLEWLEHRAALGKLRG